MIKSIINECHKPITAYIGSKQVWQHFSPDELFANGEQGVWFDPSDLSTMFQDVNGTEPVTKDGDPVGLILDKSQGVYGEQLDVVFGGRNSADVHLWQANEDGSYTLDGSQSATTYLNLKTKVTTPVKVVIDMQYHEGSPKLALGYIFNTIININPIPEGVTVWHGSPDKDFFSIRAAPGHSFTVKITMYELKGSHAIQETASARPVYRTDGKLHWLEFDGIDDKLQTSQYLYTQAGDAVYYNLKVDMLSKPSVNTWSIVSVNTETGNLQTGVIGVDEDVRIIWRYSEFYQTQLGKFNEVKHIEGYSHNVFVNNKYIDDYTPVGNRQISNANTPGILIGARETVRSHNNMKLYFLCIIKSQSELEVPNKLINYISNKGLTL